MISAYRGFPLKFIINSLGQSNSEMLTLQQDKAANKKMENVLISLQIREITR